MRAFLEVINGRYAGTTYLVETGEVCTVGGRFGADLFLPNDSLLSPLHFVLKNEAETGVLEKLSGQIFINNQPCEQGELAHGDFILAGETLFQLTIDGTETEHETVLGKLIEYLLKVENLCLLIDENLDRRILPMLHDHQADFRELKKDAKGFEAMTANPLLVKIDNRLLKTLVRSFWGKGWLVFFKPNKSWAQTVEYLQFLLAKTQINNGVDLRFYDARMLRVVLGETEKQHAQYFFGAAEKYFVESQVPSHLFEFSWKKGKVTANLIRLSPAVSKIPTQAEIAEFLTAKNLRDDFLTTTEICLQHFLPDHSSEIRTLAQASLTTIEQYKLESTAAKIQLVALNAIFGADFGESSEIVELFSSNNYSADDKLLFLVERLNQKRF